MTSFLIDCLGYLAQALFSARFFVQWIMSERAKRVLSPTIFWQISMVASCIFCLYGWLRNDFSIIVGQLVTYYIYIWNLNAHNSWKKLWLPLQW
ncbi:MAG: lipid-A-disaccharide synthase N-terminal domain-containing protein, partial [Rikenellaceae bacterium]|nr:lipid-A-disaccharide synthase N-terminal domain-containing protein [Rikenellaceae bacterium]